MGAKHLQRRQRRLPLARLTASALLGTLLVGLIATPAFAATTDLSITKTQAPANPLRGRLGSATYTVTVTNTGADTAGRVVVVDTLPAGAVYVSDTASAASCVSPNGDLRPRPDVERRRLQPFDVVAS